MKIKYIAIGLLSLAFSAKAQVKDTLYQKKELKKTAIELVYSQYIQDGNNSAVTGGIGTEKLNVYAPGLSVNWNNGRNTWSVAAGADVVSSASTDNIDFEVSSASRVDTRSHLNIGYNRRLGKKDLVLGAGAGISMESDYLSFPVLLSLNYAEPSGMRTYSALISAYFDDLRWGRLNDDYHRPVTLVYPVELRYKQWFDIYMRYTYNFKFGITQVINKRLVAGFYPEFIYQKGLLSTPFHRVYFSNDSLKVENLPRQRFRVPLGLQLRYFAGGRTILKSNINFYADNFGIRSGAIELEGTVKVSPSVSLSPFFRVYSQSSAQYFHAYKEHDFSQEYYTSDYDFSEFHSYQAGINFRLSKYKYFSKKWMFDEMIFRYAYYHRSNKLNSHIISMAFLIGNERK